MNKRIKQIEEQCYIKPGGYYPGSDWPVPFFDKQKFAELIVEECRTVVNNLYHKTPLELCGPLLTADEEIAKHFFGVEE
jgi:hypothetical protein